MPGDNTYPPTGVPQIDAQHRAIAALVAQVEEAISDGERERAVHLVVELEAEVTAHFATEERLMQGIDFPAAARHMAAHRHFLAGLRNNAEAMRAGSITPALLRWLTSLDIWFREHVIAEDLWLAVALTDASVALKATSR